MSTLIQTEKKVVEVSPTAASVDVTPDEKPVTVTRAEARVDVASVKRVVEVSEDAGGVVSVDVTETPLTVTPLSQAVSVSVAEAGVTVTEENKPLAVTVEQRVVEIEVGLNVLGVGGGGGAPAIDYVDQHARSENDDAIVFKAWSSADEGEEDESASEWRILRYNSDVVPYSPEYVDGDDSFAYIWNLRETYTYSPL